MVGVEKRVECSNAEDHHDSLLGPLLGDILLGGPLLEGPLLGGTLLPSLRGILQVYGFPQQFRAGPVK